LQKSLTKKTLIGVLASHDDPEKNAELRDVLDWFCKEHKHRFSDFHFVFTQGTFNRVVLGNELPQGARAAIKVSDTAKGLIVANATVLPAYTDGGIIVLSYLVTQRKVSILWPFLTPRTSHWLNPENLALMRLCDVWRVKRLMNEGSVQEWLSDEAPQDIGRNDQELPICLELSRGGMRGDLVLAAREEAAHWSLRPDLYTEEISGERFLGKTIALIAHNEMKPRIVEFVIDHENELRRFRRVLTTGTTGRLIKDATGKLDMILHRYHSGPFGGDIEISTEILFGLCDAVVFFVDPHHPHPHADDIRVVFGACMRKRDVRMLANEMQAREWVERVVRKWPEVGHRV